jgi:ABC-type dipeptide/oligopeptide/nickel transport system ATPase component
MQDSDDVLTVKDLDLTFVTRRATTIGLDRVSLTVGSREILGVVGETGSGKSLTLLSIMGMPPHPARITGGSIRFRSQELVGLDDATYRSLRGRDISIVVQNAKAALNPLARISDQIMAVYREKIDRGDDILRGRMLEILANVGFRDVDRVLAAYPHQISGGMAQRILIAIALGPSPRLVLFDEPTSGLDTTVGVKVMTTIRRTIGEANASAIIVTHDLGVIARFCDRVVVMAAGRVVDAAPVDEFFGAGANPHRRNLIEAHAWAAALADGVNGGAAAQGGRQDD